MADVEQPASLPLESLPPKPPSAGQLVPSERGSNQPGRGIASKLSSLKERRSLTTPPKEPAAQGGLISAVPSLDPPAEAPQPAAAAPVAPPPAAPQTQPAALLPAAEAPPTHQLTTIGSGRTNGTYTSSPSRVPRGTVAAPVVPSPNSKIPSASPQRMRRGPAGAVASARAGAQAGDQMYQYASSGGGSPVREGGWNLYNRELPRMRSSPIVVNGPSDEEKAKRRQWAIEKRKKEEMRLRLQAEKRAADEAKKRAEEDIRLEARRALVRERIVRQQEIQAKLAAERAAAEERAKSELSKFKHGKPLYERLTEEYERQRMAEEEARMRIFEEELRMKHVRPHQIIAGEVVIKPTQAAAREREMSPGRREALLQPLGGGAFTAGRHSVLGAPPPGLEHSHDFDQPYEHQGHYESAAAPQPPPVREKPRTQGMVLYSTRPKVAPPLPNVLPKLTERACSPLIFEPALILDPTSVPVNIPDQDQFWPSRISKASVLVVDTGLNSVPYEYRRSLEEGDAPQQASPTALSTAAYSAEFDTLSTQGGTLTQPTQALQAAGDALSGYPELAAEGSAISVSLTVKDDGNPDAGPVSLSVTLNDEISKAGADALDQGGELDEPHSGNSPAVQEATQEPETAAAEQAGIEDAVEQDSAAAEPVAAQAEQQPAEAEPEAPQTEEQPAEVEAAIEAEAEEAAASETGEASPTADTELVVEENAEQASEAPAQAAGESQAPVEEPAQQEPEGQQDGEVAEPPAPAPEEEQVTAAEPPVTEPEATEAAAEEAATSVQEAAADESAAADPAPGLEADSAAALDGGDQDVAPPAPEEEAAEPVAPSAEQVEAEPQAEAEEASAPADEGTEPAAPEAGSDAPADVAEPTGEEETAAEAVPDVPAEVEGGEA